VEIIKTALVTGAAKRIGRAIALDLAREGYNIAVHYNHSGAEAEAVVAEAKACGVNAVALKADLGLEAEVATLIDRARAALGPLTCLVNNASVFEYDNVQTATRADWDQHMAVNLRAPFLLSQGFERQLPSDAPAGNIINIIDQRVWRLTAAFTTYTLSKAGLWTLTQTMALGLAPRIRVNAIGPGPVLPSKRQTAAAFAHQVEALPMGKQTALSEICAAVRFILATPSYTGQMMALDGGQHLGARNGNALGGQALDFNE
jgi:NAD(P)-dependent dehydrogenase (short-subunit alcohol dehydrogenase family)